MVYRILTGTFVVALVLVAGMLPAAGAEDQAAESSAPEGAVAERPTGFAFQSEGTVTSYSESPRLTALVQAGELPPVEERLPDRPVIVTPLNGIGQYGGELRTFTRRTVDNSWARAHFNYNRMVRQKSDMSFQFVADLADSWEASDDARAYTFRIREGLKWSDGAPYTTADVEYYWNEVMKNETVEPLLPGVKVYDADIEVIDSQTFTIHFADPFGLFLLEHSLGHNTDLIQWDRHPKHYLGQFHEDHAAAAALADALKEAGVASWDLLYDQKADFQLNPELPVLMMFQVEHVDEDQGFVRYETNPYYYKVDTAGNQLPYVDGMTAQIISQGDVQLLKIAAGEFDWAIGRLRAQHYPTLKQNERDAPYTAGNNPNAKGGEFSLFLNQTTEDEVLRAVLRDRRFRFAVSSAINREEIINTVFWGAATARQSSPGPESPVYDDAWSNAYIAYDPDLANSLLDEMGLSDRGGDGFRLRPDGQTLQIEFVWSTSRGWEDAYNLVAEYMEDVGIRMISRGMPNDLLIEYVRTPDVQMTSWSVDPKMVNAESYLLPPPALGGYSAWGRRWRIWLDSDGERGLEPPPEVKEIHRLVLESQMARTAEEYQELVKQAGAIHRDNLFYFGVFGYDIRPAFAHDRLRNVRLWDVPYGAFLGAVGVEHVEQFWVDQTVAVN